MDGIAPTFADAENLLDQCRVLNLAPGEDAPLKAVDWARMLLAAEIVFVSALAGSGVDAGSTLCLHLGCPLLIGTMPQRESSSGSRESPNDLHQGMKMASERASSSRSAAACMTLATSSVAVQTTTSASCSVTCHAYRTHASRCGESFWVTYRNVVMPSPRCSEWKVFTTGGSTAFGSSASVRARRVGLRGSLAGPIAAQTGSGTSVGWSRCRNSQWSDPGGHRASAQRDRVSPTNSTPLRPGSSSRSDHRPSACSKHQDLMSSHSSKGAEGPDRGGTITQE